MKSNHRRLVFAFLLPCVSACGNEAGGGAFSDGAGSGGAPPSFAGSGGGISAGGSAVVGGAPSTAVEPEVCSADGWCWDAPMPQGNTLRAAWATSWSDVWAVGDRGTVIHYDGTGFRRIEVPTQENLNAIWGDEGSLWAVGEAGAVVHFDGSSWKLEALPALPGTTGPVTTSLSGVWGHEQEVWIAGAEGHVIHFDGSSFNHEVTNTRVRLHSIWVDELGNVVASGDRGTLLRRENAAWSLVPSGTMAQLFSVRGTSPTNIYAAGSGGTVLHYDGSSWQSVSTGILSVQSVARAIVPLEQGGCFWFGANGGAFVFEAGRWEERPSLVSLDLLGGVSLEGRTLAVGQGGAMVLWDEGGRSVLAPGGVANHLGISAAPASQSPTIVGDGMWMRDSERWSDVGLDSRRSLYGLALPDANTGFAVGTGGTILTRSGGPWSLERSGTTAWLHAVWSDGNAAWAVGENGTILGLTGGVFTPVPVVSSADLFDVWGASAGMVWAVGGGEILRYSSGTWQRFTNPADPSITLRGVWGASADDAWAVGTRGTILHFNGAAWSIVATDQSYSLNDVWGLAPDRIWAVGTNGVILHFDGSSFAPESSGVAQTLNAIWGGGQRLWAVGEGGTIVRHAL